jgi:hypothetical protein
MKVKSEDEARRLFSGFVPPKIKAQLDANREPSEAEIAAAKALLAKVGKGKSQ